MFGNGRRRGASRRGWLVFNWDFGLDMDGEERPWRVRFYRDKRNMDLMKIPAGRHPSIQERRPCYMNSLLLKYPLDR